MTEQRYFAALPVANGGTGVTGGQEFLYPHAGDPPAPLDTKVLLLSKGGICTTGYWNATWCLGWLPLPKRNTEKEDIK
jgi:hypothetical protein